MKEILNIQSFYSTMETFIRSHSYIIWNNVRIFSKIVFLTVNLNLKSLFPENRWKMYQPFINVYSGNFSLKRIRTINIKATISCSFATITYIKCSWILKLFFIQTENLITNYHFIISLRWTMNLTTNASLE